MIYLLRHGEIEAPPGRRFIGQVDYPLSARGRSQAEYWKAVLAGKGITSIFCSDLTRSMETARIIAGEAGGGMNISGELREIALGEWDGCPMQEIRDRFPEAWEERGRAIDTFRTPGGESFRDLYDRVVPVFESISRSGKGNVLIAGHAGVNRMILCHVLEIPISKLFSIGQDYGALNIIENKEDGLHVISMNDNP